MCQTQRVQKIARYNVHIYSKFAWCTINDQSMSIGHLSARFSTTLPLKVIPFFVNLMQCGIFLVQMISAISISYVHVYFMGMFSFKHAT